MKPLTEEQQKNIAKYLGVKGGGNMKKEMELNEDKSTLKVDISGKYDLLEVSDLFRALKQKELEMKRARDQTDFE